MHLAGVLAMAMTVQACRVAVRSCVRATRACARGASAKAGLLRWRGGLKSNGKVLTHTQYGVLTHIK